MYAPSYVWAKVILWMEERLTALAISASFDDVEVIDLSEEELIIYSPNEFRRDIIQRRYTQYIQDALKEIFNSNAKLVVFGDKELDHYRNKGKKARVQDETGKSTSSISEKPAS